jgi:hypothetical protein
MIQEGARASARQRAEISADLARLSVEVGRAIRAAERAEAEAERARRAAQEVFDRRA